MGNLFSWLFGPGLPAIELQKKHVVIIGGGYGGAELAVQLKKSAIPFTLIDPKDYFHHNVAALRAAVYPEWMNKSAIYFKDTFGDSFIQAKVTNVDFNSQQVFLDIDHEPIEYTDLVIAVGSSGPFPGRPMSNYVNEATREYLNLSDEIEKANDIVIIGGGAVGVEIAGEIGEKYKLKRMTLIHPSEKFVGPDFSDKFQANIKSALESFNVEMVLGDRVENLNDLTTGSCIKQTVKTKQGKTIECDLVLRCTGLAPNTGLTKSIFAETKFDESKRLKVNEYLQIDGYDNVFGIGDCINTKEHKMAAHASTHAKLIVTNLIRQMKGQKLQPYSPAFDGMLVTVGSSAGAGMMNGWNFPSFIVGMAKGKTLFTSKFWDMMGQPMPK